MDTEREVAKRETSAATQKYILMGDKEPEHEKKKHYYKMALAIEPKNVAALNKMALLFYKQEKYREAIEYFDVIIDSGKVRNLYPIYYNKSVALKALKEYEAALNYVSKALNFEYENPQAEELKKELQEIVDEKSRRQTERQKQAAHSMRQTEKKYASWDPPAISILANMMYYKDWHAHDNREDFEITEAQKEKVAIKLADKEFCCATCYFYRNGTCKKKKGIPVDAKAICRAFHLIIGNAS